MKTIESLLRLDSVRLLTLVGPGGVGKTRLAIEVAALLESTFRDGVTFVPIATLSDPDLVIPAIAQAFGIRPVSNRPLKTTLLRFLRDRNALLLIDNFEPVIEAAPVLSEVLANCPLITMLVTSRFVLRISGEHVYRVPPLHLPHGHAAQTVADMRESDAIRLFVERARAVLPTFDLTQDNAPTIAAICQKLDVLPLALELAAARLSMLSPTALLSRLDGPSTLLTGGPHDAPARHQSLQNAIAWSYDLLPLHEQRAFRLVSVFSGGFTLAAAQAVVDEQGDLLETLSSLGAKSLIMPVETTGPEPRFTMLETLREYGLAALSAQEEIVANQQHAAWFASLAEQSEYAWAMPLEEGIDRLHTMEMESANLRKALHWLVGSGDTERALRMASHLVTHWVVGGHLEEGRTWLQSLLDHDEIAGADTLVRAKALRTLAWISNQQGAVPKAFRLADQGLAAFSTIEHVMGMVECFVLSSITAARLKNVHTALTRHHQAMKLLETIDGPVWVHNWAHSQLVQLALSALTRGDFDEFETLLNKALEIQTAQGVAPGTSHITGGNVLAGLGTVNMLKGNPTKALDYFRQCLELAWRFSNVRSAVHGLGEIAGTLASMSQYREAATLFGASEAAHELYGYPFSETIDWYRALGLPEPWAREGESLGDAEAFRDALGTRRLSPMPSPADHTHLAQLWDEGRALTLEEAVMMALDASVSAMAGGDTASRQGLSPRETEVLRLLVQGVSNKAIADALSLSERTVEHHVTSILNKLGLESRTAAATYAVRHGLV